MRLRPQQKQVDLRIRMVAIQGVEEEARRNGVEAEKNKDRSSHCAFRLRVLTYFVFNEVFWS